MKRLLVSCVLAAASVPLLSGAAPEAPKPAPVPATSQPPSAAPATQPADSLLNLALESPQALQFAEQATSTCDRYADLRITSGRGPDGKPKVTTVPSGTMWVFRADADKDDFTRHGGWYWTCNGVDGKATFKTPGSLIMVVRDTDGTLHWYAMQPDFRC